jgi:hypothetical protein
MPVNYDYRHHAPALNNLISKRVTFARGHLSDETAKNQE